MTIRTATTNTPTLAAADAARVALWAAQDHGTEAEIQAAYAVWITAHSAAREERLAAARAAEVIHPDEVPGAETESMAAYNARLLRRLIDAGHVDPEKINEAEATVEELNREAASYVVAPEEYEYDITDEADAAVDWDRLVNG